MIDTAVDAARAGDWPACLTALIAAWRAARVPALAEAIDRVAARAPGAVVGPREIRARIERVTAIDVVEIVATIRRQLRTQPGFAVHARALADAAGPDPRIAALLADLARRSPFAKRIGALDGEVVDRLVAIDDPRFRAFVVAAAAELAPRRTRASRQRAAIEHLIATAARVAELPPAPAASPELLAAIAAIDAALAAPSRDHAIAGDRAALFAAVYANPGDVAARLVLADVLQAAGDPRGELIALQCARADDATPTRRERALLATHARAWLGSLDAVVQKQGVVFRRGFAATARLAINQFREVPTDPAWQTLEELDLVHGWSTHVARFLPTLRALRRVASFYYADLETLFAAAPSPLAWTSFGMRYANAEAMATFARLAPAALPALVELDLAHVPCDPELLRPLGRALVARLARVVMAANPRAPAPVVATLDVARALGLRALALVRDFEFAPIAKHAPIVLDLATGRATIPARVDVRWATALLPPLAPAHVREVALAPAAAPDLRAAIDALGIPVADG